MERQDPKDPFAQTRESFRKAIERRFNQQAPKVTALNARTTSPFYPNAGTPICTLALAALQKAGMEEVVPNWNLQTRYLAPFWHPEGWEEASEELCAKLLAQDAGLALAKGNKHTVAIAGHLLGLQCLLIAAALTTPWPQVLDTLSSATILAEAESFVSKCQR